MPIIRLRRPSVGWGQLEASRGLDLGPSVHEAMITVVQARYTILASAPDIPAPNPNISQASRVRDAVHARVGW